MSSQTKHLRFLITFFSCMLSLTGFAVTKADTISPDQIMGVIPRPLPFGQSLLLIWSQITGLITSTIRCLVFSYLSFMKKESSR